MKKKKILLVEDEFVVASDIEECLETSGYIVSGIISDGETAITKIEKNRPDLVMMDIKLNGKLSGTETAAIVKTRFNIPVIYLSAFSQESIMTQVRDSEPFGYLKKPFREKELLMALEIAFCRDSNEKKLFKQLQDSRELTKESERSLHQKVKVIQLLQEVIIASNEAKTVEEVMQLCLDDVCNFMNWPVGHLYTVDSKGTLVSSKIWHFKNAEKFKAFRKVTENTSFDRGVGLPGRVLASGKPVWVKDVTLDRNFPRAKLVKNLGIKAGFAFPVLEGQKVVSVLEFFSTETMEPAEIILEALSNFAVQVGRVTERKKVENMLKEHNKILEQKNAAIREVLIQIELEKKEVINNVKDNAENFLLPLLAKIEAKKESSEFIKILHKNLLSLTSSFGTKLTEKEAKLTPRELEICNLIKNGLLSKEIANLLNLSPRTLEVHRANIRKKFCLTRKKVNLVSFLKSI